ncbi:nuclear transport factor 2 family protein [Muricauda oceani]|uniref:Nuclear transport factor 2 family protein n=1 Tax=Flagellimonas oceani TaxID=2698672 RepID=A0A6G7J3V4_9FLAO|nr:nuclear transport factor 2 family protein [Allomuricauda oceani]MBW8242705.1 nuclear transport factor 2 family protein [Allomuricauda oceani]QII45553.1 nuclear transport factor 2 family protein [Allomuricauda oceani]
MKKYLIEFSTITKHCFLGILLCFSTTLVAQKNTAEVKKIDDAVSQLYKAMVNRNKDKLEELTMESLTYGHSSGKIENKKEYVDGVLNGGFQFSSITPVDQTITTSGKTGVVRHIFKGEGTNNGTPATVNIGCLLVFQKEGKQWKLLARQAYKL